MEPGILCYREHTSCLVLGDTFVHNYTCTFLRSNIPPLDDWRSSTNFDVKSPRDFSCLPVTGGGDPLQSESDISEISGPSSLKQVTPININHKDGL